MGKEVFYIGEHPTLPRECEVTYNNPQEYYYTIKFLYPRFDPTKDIINCFYNYDTYIIEKSCAFEDLNMKKEELKEVNKTEKLKSYFISIGDKIISTFVIYKGEIHELDPVYENQLNILNFKKWRKEINPPSYEELYK